MAWKNMKLLLASTAAIAITSQVCKKIYKYYKDTKESSLIKVQSNDTCSEINQKNRDLNDVIVFTEDVVHHTITVPPNSNVAVCESRELNCFKLISYLKSARETLDVCMYLITSDEIADQIIKLGRKHIIVRILVDSDMAYIPTSQIKRLQQYSFIHMQTSKPEALMHHKFCIIDGPKAIKRKNYLRMQAESLNIHAKSQIPFKPQTKSKLPRGFIMSGSLNWSTQSMVKNYESVIVTSSPLIVNKFETEFERLWLEKSTEKLA